MSWPSARAAADDIAPAAAMGTMIFHTNIAARLTCMALARGLLQRTQRWRGAVG